MRLPQITVSEDPHPLDDDRDPVDHFFGSPWFEVNTLVLRKTLRLSQREFSRRFGFPVATLRHWERGDRKPSGAALAFLHVIAYNPAVATRALIRARRKFADRLAPEPGIRPDNKKPRLGGV